MRVVIQRVSEASVTISGKVVGEIAKGMLILLGIETEDTQQDINWLAGKISKMRIFQDQEGLMNKSIIDVEGDILIVSQFTLYASTKKGNRPGFIRSAKPEIARPLYLKMITQLENEIKKPIQKGEFGANMNISLVNDGPVTIIMDTKNKE